jgi:hypothetical protein
MDSTRQVAEVVQDKAHSPAVVYVVRTSWNAYMSLRCSCPGTRAVDEAIVIVPDHDGGRRK